MPYRQVKKITHQINSDAYSIMHIYFFKNTILNIAVVTTAFLILHANSIKAQIVGSVKTFSIEDGIPHPTINDIKQDKKGYIWLATYGGICKYNGIKFEAIRPTKDDKIQFSNYRINNIQIDTQGLVWMTGADNDNSIACYNSNTQKFWGTSLINTSRYKNIAFTSVIVSKSNQAWIKTNNKGIVHVNPENFQCTFFNCKSLNLPSDTIFAIHEDYDNNTWILTSNGIARINNSTLKTEDTFLNDSFYTALEFNDEIWFGGKNGAIFIYSKKYNDFRTLKVALNSNISYLTTLNASEIIAISSSKGFAKIDVRSGDCKIYNKDNIPNLADNNIITIATSNNKLWFTSRKLPSINIFNFETNKLTSYINNSNINIDEANKKTHFLYDKQNNIWIQENSLLSVYNKQTEKIIPFYNNNNSIIEGNNSYRIAFFDQQGNLWLHKAHEGLKLLSFLNNAFSTINIKPQNPNQKNEVRAILQDSKNNILLGTRQNQLLLYDNNFNYECMIDSNGVKGNKSVWKSCIYSIIEDNKQNIWIGTRGSGLYRLKPTKNPNKYEVSNYKFNTNNHYSISSNDIYRVYQDKKNRIWIATTLGINCLHEFSSDSIQFISHRNKWKSYPAEQKTRIRCITELSSGLIISGGENGLLCFNGDSIQHSTKAIKQYRNVDFISDWSKSSDVIDICISNKNIYFVTETLLKVDSLSKNGFPAIFAHCDKKNTLPFSNIMSLQEDLDHKIWITSDNSIAKYSPNHEEFETFSFMPWKNKDSYFSEATRYLLPTGEILFGYSNGLIHFSPSKIKPNNYAPYLAILNFQISDKITPQQNKPVNKNIDS